MKHTLTILAVLSAVAGTVSTVLAQSDQAGAPAMTSGPLLDTTAAKVDPGAKVDAGSKNERKAKASLDIYGDYSFSSDFKDTEGSFDVTRVGAAVGMRFPAFSTSEVGVGISAERWYFGFKDATAFDAADGKPWKEVNSLDLSLTFTNQVTDHWSYTVGVFGQAAYADGADISDALRGGGLLGATYKFSDTFSLGGGVAVSSQIEDDVVFRPLLIVDWKISETLSLKSTPAVGRRLLGLVYEPCDEWKFSLGGGVEFLDFRLDDQAPAPEGVGRFRRAPVGVDVTWSPTKQFSVSLYGGVLLFQELTLDDRTGERIVREEADPSAFIGGGVQWRF